jgi:uncharacterized protein YjgD (DUF1641 family)
MEAGKVFMDEAVPKFKELSEELNPLLIELRKNLDRDETILLLTKLTQNIDSLLQLLNLMEAGKVFMDEAVPKFKELSEELAPKINRLRELLDDDETWKLLEYTLVLKKPLTKLVESMVVDGEGKINTEEMERTFEVLAELTAILKQPAFQKMMSGVVEGFRKLDEEEIKKVSAFGMFSAMRDEDVQRGMGAIFSILKALGKSLK